MGCQEELELEGMNDVLVDDSSSDDVAVVSAVAVGEKKILEPMQKTIEMIT
jgi:hypothetical protein